VPTLASSQIGLPMLPPVEWIAVSNSTNIAPRQTRTKRFRLLTKMHGSFAAEVPNDGE
jgi:hypothetical protein